MTDFNELTFGTQPLETDYERQIRADERRKMLELINRHIKRGKIQGDGYDLTAQRNGMILAYNLIFDVK